MTFTFAVDCDTRGSKKMLTTTFIAAYYKTQWVGACAKQNQDAHSTIAISVLSPILPAQTPVLFLWLSLPVSPLFLFCINFDIIFSSLGADLNSNLALY